MSSVTIALISFTRNRIASLDELIASEENPFAQYNMSWYDVEGPTVSGRRLMGANVPGEWIPEYDTMLDKYFGRLILRVKQDIKTNNITCSHVDNEFLVHARKIPKKHNDEGEATEWYDINTQSALATWALAVSSDHRPAILEAMERYQARI